MSDCPRVCRCATCKDFRAEIIKTLKANIIEDLNVNARVLWPDIPYKWFVEIIQTVEAAGGKTQSD
jgi:hypothetical protein